MGPKFQQFGQLYSGMTGGCSPLAPYDTE